MPVYTVTPALPAVVFVQNSNFPSEKPWEGATVIYDGNPTKPLHVTGPFDVPPYAQDNIRRHFEEVYAKPIGEQRQFLVDKGQWVIPEPEVTPAPPEDGEPKEA